MFDVSPVEAELSPAAAPATGAEQPRQADPVSLFAPSAASSSDKFDVFEGIDDDDDEFESTVVIARAKSTTDWSLVDIDGTKFPLAPQNVLGRKPKSGPSGAQFIALSDPERVLSRTHLLIEVEDDQLWITDLKSTNGTEIIMSDQGDTEPGKDTDFRPCEALSRYAVTADQSLSLGGRSITFDGPASS